MTQEGAACFSDYPEVLSICLHLLKLVVSFICIFLVAVLWTVSTEISLLFDYCFSLHVAPMVVSTSLHILEAPVCFVQNCDLNCVSIILSFLILCILFFSDSILLKEYQEHIILASTAVGCLWCHF